tara:strand:+ start:556 stop:912 length:357 start_codon:yes stop_codon:yes gene_type:complete
MAQKSRSKTLYVELNTTGGGFASKLIGTKLPQNFSDIKLLRNLLTNEKARILYTLNHEKPKSIYSLAKILKRDFKSVREDLIILERFGFISFNSERVGKRKSLMPILLVDTLKIEINV